VRQNVQHLIASTGFFSVGYSLLIFAIPLFAISVGCSQSELGFIALAYTLPSLAVVVLVGRFLNKAKAMRVIQVVLIAHALSTMIVPYGSNFFQLAGIRTVQGFFGIAFWVAMEKELADLASDREKGRVVGFYNVAWASAFIAAPLLGGFFIDKFNYTTAFEAAFLLQVAALVPTLFLKPQRSDSLSVVVENKTFSEQRWEPSNLMAAWLTSGVTGAILGVVFSLFSAYVTLLGFSVIWAGFFMLDLSVSRAATFLGVGFFMERVGERKFMLLGMFLAVSATVLGLTNKAELLTLTLLVLGLACGMTQASALTLVSRSPTRARGSAIGKLEFSFYLSFALMSQLGGISADFLGLSSPYIISGVVAIVGSIALLTLYARTHCKTPALADIH
jgi:MFS family permease